MISPLKSPQFRFPSYFLWDAPTPFLFDFSENDKIFCWHACNLSGWVSEHAYEAGWPDSKFQKYQTYENLLPKIPNFLSKDTKKYKIRKNAKKTKLFIKKYQKYQIRKKYQTKLFTYQTLSKIPNLSNLVRKIPNWSPWFCLNRGGHTLLNWTGQETAEATITGRQKQSFRLALRVISRHAGMSGIKIGKLKAGTK